MSLYPLEIIDDINENNNNIKRKINVNVIYSNKEYPKLSFDDDGEDEILKVRIPYGELEVIPNKTLNKGDDISISLDLPKTDQLNQSYKIHVEGLLMRPYVPSNKDEINSLDSILPPHSKTYNPSLLFYKAPTFETDPYLLKHSKNESSENLEEVVNEADAEYNNHSNKRQKTKHGGQQKHTEDPAPEKRLWVQCDRCTKWRRLPSFVTLDMLPPKWFCENNPDSNYNNCDVDQEVDVDATHTTDDQMDSELIKQKSINRKRISKRIYPEGLKLYDNSDTFCSVCFNVSSYLDGTVLPSHVPALVGCAGQCRRAFHPDCVHRYRTLRRSRVKNAEWYCQDCLKGQHRCCVCNELGNDGQDLLLCHFNDDCNSYYHIDCVPTYNDNIKVNCSKHQCRYCTNTSNDDKLIQCKLCSFACHDRKECRPKNIKILSNNSALCPLHATGLHGRDRRLVNLTQSMQYDENDMAPNEDHEVEIEASNQLIINKVNNDNRLKKNSDIPKTPVDTVKKEVDNNEGTKLTQQQINLPLPYIVDPNLKILNFGQLILGDNYMTDECYYPIGWKSVRSFRRTDYINEIINQGSRPLFLLQSVEIPDHNFRGSSPQEVWEQAAQALKEHQSRKRTRSSRGRSRSTSAVIALPASGVEMFGLNVKEIKDAFDVISEQMDTISIV